MVYHTNIDNANLVVRADVSGNPNLADNHINAFDPKNVQEIRSAYHDMNAYGRQNAAQHVNPMKIAVTPAELRDGSLGLNTDGVEWAIKGPGGTFHPEPVYQKGDENLSLDDFLKALIGRLTRNAKGEMEALGMSPEEYKEFRDARSFLTGCEGG